MRLSPSMPVRDILGRAPGARRVFERHRVDYCCHGGLPLAQACERAGANIDAVLASLAREAARPCSAPSLDDALARMSVPDIVALLVNEVHPRERRAIAELRSMCPRQGALGATVRRLCDELDPHLAFEEVELFPFLLTMARGRIIPARFASVRDADQALMADHEAADHLLDELRALTSDYTAPTQAAAPLYRALAEHHRALVEHMHIEGNVLFPRAERMEDALRAAHAPSLVCRRRHRMRR